MTADLFMNLNEIQQLFKILQVETVKSSSSQIFILYKGKYHN